MGQLLVQVLPLCVVGGEEGLANFVRLVRAAWDNDEDYVIDLTEFMALSFTKGMKCTIEFRRGGA